MLFDHHDEPESSATPPLSTAIKKRRHLPRADYAHVRATLEQYLVSVGEGLCSYKDGMSDAAIVALCDLPALNINHVRHIRMEIGGVLFRPKKEPAKAPQSETLETLAERVSRLEALVATLMQSR